MCGAEDAALVGEVDCSRHPLYRKELPPTIRWLCCATCQHVFSDGYFGSETLTLLFSNAHQGQLPGEELPRLASGREISAQIIERINGFREHKLSGRWLDVGFGNGALLTTAAEFGFDVVGLDVRHQAVDRLKEYGFEAHRAELMTFQSEARFDVISLADVLEHMAFPGLALQRAHGLLNDHGLLFISMPNLESFMFQSLDRAGQNPYWGELEHFHNFTRRTLFMLLRGAEFRPLSYGISLRYSACMEVIAQRV